MKKSNEFDKHDVDYLLDVIFNTYGHDFRNYARASIERRIRNFQSKSNCSEISRLTEKVKADRRFFSRLLQEFSIMVTEMFRDPDVYLSIRKKVIPFLKTHPFVKIWHAGCATGEEAYSLAIVLKEEGLYDRATVFVTDYNDQALEQAKKGIYPVDKTKPFTDSYLAAGGKSSFSDYYTAHYDSMMINRSLRANMTFANYNLVTDGVFGEMHFILCRNVLIYFNRTLQDRVIHLFSESLIHGGFLCLGTKESLDFSTAKPCFEHFDHESRIYRKRT